MELLMAGAGLSVEHLLDQLKPWVYPSKSGVQDYPQLHREFQASLGKERGLVRWLSGEGTYC